MFNEENIVGLQGNTYHSILRKTAHVHCILSEAYVPHVWREGEREREREREGGGGVNVWVY